LEYTSLIEFNWTLVMNIVTLLVLYFILKKFFFEKVHNFMLSREQTVRDAFEEAEQTNALAKETLEEYNRQLADIDAKGRAMMKESKLRADARAGEIVDEAKRKAADILTQAEKQIEAERKKAAGDMRGQIVSLALYAAEKVLEKEMGRKEQAAFIDGIIEQAEISEWKH
jgi:F-type H+-transporting ATPase subunit b